MFKVIFKTALKTILVVAVLALVAFAIASLGFPSEMAGLCERSGNYSLATGYAQLSYSYSKNVNDLNRCFVDSVYANDDYDVVKYGDELIANDGFLQVCEDNTKTYITESGTEITVDYKQYVYGNVSAAKYRKGDRDGAVSLATAAMEGVQGFPANNALAILSLQVINNGDKDTAATLLTEVQKHEDAGNEYYNVLINELNELTKGGQE